MLPHWTESTVNIGDDVFHYTRTGHGDKPPLVLLHGFSDNGLCWLPVPRDLEADYDVVLPDARGHGLSARLEPGVQTDGAGDAAGLIQVLDLNKPVVGGHSMGGATATEFGPRFPDLVRSLILEDPAWIDPAPDEVPLDENPWFEWLQHLDEVSQGDIIAKGKADNPTWPDHEFPAWAESKRQLDLNIFKGAYVRKPWRDFVSAIQVPTLLITAEVERGAIVTPNAAEEATSLSPFIQVAYVPDAGHNIRRENYPGYMAALRSFLDQIG